MVFSSHVSMQCPWRLLAVIASFLWLLPDSKQAEDQLTRQGRLALEYVERVRSSPCTGGTEETLPVNFDHAQWAQYAEVAVRMSNLLTKIIVQGNNSLGDVDDEFLFDLVRNNVDTNSLAFGSAIAVEERVYPKYTRFCPYAYKKDAVYAHDISLNYNYLDPSTEWYHVLAVRNWSSADVTHNFLTYRFNETSHDAGRILLQPVARREDGHWTRPYFDCGGGDIWMVTYSAPVFGLVPDTDTPFFQGIGTIDIELTNIDINQCDAPDDGTGGGSVDVFRETHHCQPSTQCRPLVGRGFIRGAYVCECRRGFYYPYLEAKHKAFNGTAIEEYFASGVNVSGKLDRWECLQCPEECDECVDATPCLYAPIMAVRIVLLVLTLAITSAIIVLSAIVAAYKHRRSIKSSSPMFLHVMTTGAALMCLPMFVRFGEPTDLTCAVRVWPRHLGFALLYGALLLKTWRVSMIFKVKSARRLNLSDKVLSQRFVPILGVTLGYLVAWTALDRPVTVWRRTTTDLKFKDCVSNWWEYGAQAAEAIFLLWGAYLCYVVRKAPSHFNESKYITWSIYNNIILGSFIIIIKQFIAVQQGPDIIYVVDFIYIQISVTGTMLLIFAHKLWGLRGKDSDDDAGDTTVTGMPRVAGKAPPAMGNDVIVDTTTIGTQTDLSQIDCTHFLQPVSENPTVPSGSRLLTRSNRVSPVED